MQANASPLALQPCFSQIYTEAKPLRCSQWIKKQKRILVWGFVVQLYSRKWQPLSSVTRTLSFVREKTDRSMALYYNIFRWKRLKAGLHTPMPNTAPFIVTRYLAMILQRQRPSVQLRPLDVPQWERESTARERGEPNEKSTYDTSSERGERERKREVGFSYGKCFSYKSFFLTRPPCLLLECSIFKKVAALPCQFPQCSKGRDGLTDKQKVEGKALWQMEFGLILKGAVTLSLQTYKVGVLRLLHNSIPTVPDYSVLFPFKCKSTLSKDLLVSHKPLPNLCPFFPFFFFLEGFGISYADLIVFILQERGEVALLLWWGTEGGAVCISGIGLAVWFLIQGSRARAGHGAAV